MNYKNEDIDEFLLFIFDGSKVWKGKCKNKFRLFIGIFIIGKVNVYRIEMKIKFL